MSIAVPCYKSPDEYTGEDYKGLLQQFPYRHGTSPHTKHIAVIGAGMSGLVAAALLKRAGHSVTIFEASNTVGGRVRTLRDGFTRGFYAEAGAMRIPKHHELTRWLGQQFNLLEGDDDSGTTSGRKQWVFPNHCDDAYYYINGAQVKVADYKKNPDSLKFGSQPGEKGKTATDLLALAVKRYLKENEAHATAVSDALSISSADLLNREWSEDEWQKVVSAINESKELLKELDRFSLRQFLHNSISRSAANHICAVLGLDMSLSASMVSVLRIFHNTYLSKELYQIAGGMDLLPKSFVGLSGVAFSTRDFDLKDNMEYNSRLEEMAWDQVSGRTHVKLEVANTVTRERRNTYFDVVVVAIPFPSLRHVRLRGLATPEKRAAFRQLGYHNACKILLEFKKPFWRQGELHVRGGRSITDLPVRQIYYPNEKQNDGCVLLASYTWGEESIHWTALSHEDRVRFALRDMARVHKVEPAELASNFVGGVSHNWIQDGNTAGAFAVFEPYQGVELFDAIWKPEGRIHYCGEHTSNKHGWIEGAVESGVRVADEICRAVDEDPQLERDLPEPHYV